MGANMYQSILLYNVWSDDKMIDRLQNYQKCEDFEALLLFSSKILEIWISVYVVIPLNIYLHFYFE